MSKLYNFREFAESTFDFVRCIKPNGDIYGIPEDARCRKGRRISARNNTAVSATSKTTRRIPNIPRLIQTIYHFPSEIPSSPPQKKIPTSIPASQLTGDLLDQNTERHNDLPYPELLKQNATTKQRAIINRAREKHREKWQKYQNHRHYDPNYPKDEQLEQLNVLWLNYNPDLLPHEIPIYPGSKLKTLENLYENDRKNKSETILKTNSDGKSDLEKLPVIVPRSVPSQPVAEIDPEEDLLLWLGDDDDYDEMGDDTETLEDFFSSYNHPKFRPPFINGHLVVERTHLTAYPFQRNIFNHDLDESTVI